MKTSGLSLLLALVSLGSLAQPLLSQGNIVSIPLTQMHTLEGAIASVVRQQHVDRCLQRLAFAQGLSLLRDTTLKNQVTPLMGLLRHEPRASSSDLRVQHLEIQGQDIGYYGPLEIGTPPRTFQLLVDSGSADLWVGAEGCVEDNTGNGCGPHALLGPRSSSTYAASEEQWVIWYGTGAVSGVLVEDNVSIGGLTVAKHRFGVAKNESSDFTGVVSFDGILGMAQSGASRQNTPTYIRTLTDSGLLKQAIASFKIPRKSDGKNDGEMTLGGMNTAKYDPKHITTVRNVNERGFWEVDIEDVKVNGKSLGLNGRSAVVDTGATLILAPSHDAASIHALVHDAEIEDGGWILPCSTDAHVVLTIGGMEFPIQSSDMAWLPIDDDRQTCVSGISEGGVTTEGPNVWLLGDVFLKNVYLSLNHDTNELTFARLV